jgi:hypothetical protein
MQADFHAEVARETARQVHDLQSVTAAQAMPALCFLHGAYAPGAPWTGNETTPRSPDAPASAGPF